MVNIKTTFTNDGGGAYHKLVGEIIGNNDFNDLNENIEIHDLNSILFKYRLPKKLILIIHHIDYSIEIKGYIKHYLNKILYSLVFKRIPISTYIITVSKYWQNYFKSLGYFNTKLIYNSFDFKKYKRSKRDLNLFRKKYAINTPFIYIGNCQKSKGVVEVYHSLKDAGYTLITSGQKQIDLPITNLNLNDYDYITMLYLSDITITMSKFKEGWNRTAHESMLCGTPIIGSGLGGMGELLTNSNQIICNDLSKLSYYVNYVYDNYDDLQMHAMEYSTQFKFSLENFKNNWQNIINEIKNL